MPSKPIAGEGYVDLQVNGFGGIDFNGDSLTAEELHTVCVRLREDGAAAFLPTVITDDLDVMCGRLGRLCDLRQQSPLAIEMIHGFHIEGPFISGEPGFVGAHPAEHVRPARLDDAKRLLEAAGGLARLVTLAPECDADCDTTRYLASQGIVVSAGHCNPTLDVLKAAIDSGLTMFTHLGNACPNQAPKHDNVIQRVLSLAGKLRISFIADGFHVPFFALGNYFNAAGLDRCVVVSDAISAAGQGTGTFWVAGREAHVDEDLVPRSADRSHYVGSATSVALMVERLKSELGLDAASIRQLTCVGPREALSAKPF